MQVNERLQRTKSELEKANLWKRVKVRSFQTDDEDRVRGCYSSHIAVLTEIQSSFRGRSNYSVLVLEDNLEVTQGMSDLTVAAVRQAIFIHTLHALKNIWAVLYTNILSYLSRGFTYWVTNSHPFIINPTWHITLPLHTSLLSFYQKTSIDSTSWHLF